MHIELDAPDMGGICLQRPMNDTMEPSFDPAALIRNDQGEEAQDNAIDQLENIDDGAADDSKDVVEGDWRSPDLIVRLHHPSEDEWRNDPCHQDHREHADNRHLCQ